MARKARVVELWEGFWSRLVSLRDSGKSPATLAATLCTVAFIVFVAIGSVNGLLGFIFYIVLSMGIWTFVYYLFNEVIDHYDNHLRKDK